MQMDTSLDTYLDGQVLLVSSHSEGKVYSYDGTWHEYPISEARGIAGLSVMGDQEIVEFDLDGNPVATIDTPQTLAHEAVQLSRLYITAPQSSNILVYQKGQFSEYWRVPGVDASNDHRSHINGIGVRDGVVRYATTLGISNTPDDGGRTGWRLEAWNKRGALIDVKTNTIIFQDLDFPHSPRWWNGRIYYLASNDSQLMSCNEDGSDRQMVAQLTGFLRGLIFNGNYAFVGCSLGRFSPSNPVPQVDENTNNCGVVVIDLTTGEQVHFEHIDAKELFDVQFGTAVFG